MLLLLAVAELSKTMIAISMNDVKVAGAFSLR